MSDLEIINRVANSNLTTIDLADYYLPGERVLYDLKENLFMEAILKEKDFRDFVKNHNWQQYSGKHVAVTCSVEAIIPAWAFMILATKLEPYAQSLIFGGLAQLEEYLFKSALSKVDWSIYKDSKIVIKGCGDLPIPNAAFFEIARLLAPYTSSIMYGEPCSTVPVYKKSKS